MDMKKDRRIPNCGSLQELDRTKIVVGAKQLRKALERSRAEYVFLAENADPAVTGPIEALCRESQVQITWVRTMADLGRACGIDVGAAAAAVLR